MKRSLILLAVFVVLLGIYWLVQSQRPVVSAEERPLVVCDSAAVNLLRIVFGMDTVEMVKEGDGWMISRPLRYPAAARTIGTALGKLREMQRLSLITDKPGRHSEFQVNDSAGTRVTVGQGAKSTAFYLGKAGPSAGTCYARLDGSSEVWEIAGNQTPTFKRKAKDWRDKTITELAGQDVRNIVLRYPEQTIALALVDSVWKVDAGTEKFDGEKGLVERLTNLLSRMSAVDFADTLAPGAFDQPALHLTADLVSGEAIDLKLIPKDEAASQYFVRKQGALADFVIYKSTANVLMKKADDFRAKAEAAAAKAAP